MSVEARHASTGGDAMAAQHISDIVPGYDFTAWFIVAVPAGIPPELVKKISADAVETVNSPISRAMESPIIGTAR